jgi:hypothetical protein
MWNEFDVGRCSFGMVRPLPVLDNTVIFCDKNPGRKALNARKKPNPIAVDITINPTKLINWSNKYCKLIPHASIGYSPWLFWNIY